MVRQFRSEAVSVDRLAETSACERLPLHSHVLRAGAIAVAAEVGELLVSICVAQLGEGSPGHIQPWAERLMYARCYIGGVSDGSLGVYCVQISSVVITGAALYAAVVIGRHRYAVLLVLLASAAFLVGSLRQVTDLLQTWVCQCLP
jgi:hypothetical protein